MPRPFNPDSPRVVSELPETTRRQLAELIDKLGVSLREVQIQAIADLYELVIVDEYAVQAWPEVIDELRKELDTLRQRVAVLEGKGE